MKRLFHIHLILVSFVLIGCAGGPHVGSKQTATAGNATTSSAKSSFFSKFQDFSFANLLPGSGVKIVKVREKDLRELPTGRERALAYQNSRKGGFWIFGGPVDFKEPKLPEQGTEPEGSLLPPKVQ